MILVLTVSVGLHVVAGIGAGIWVVARYFARPEAQFVPQRDVKMPPEDRKHRLQMEEATSLRAKPVYNNRIQSLKPSNLALPELPKVVVDVMTPLDTEALVTDQVDGLGGTGGTGTGLGTGGGFFGGSGNAGSGLLAGGLYDLKQSRSGEPIKMNGDRYYDLINHISRSSNAAGTLSNFFRAPDTLYMPQLAIPVINANEAPKQFKVEKQVKPAYWWPSTRGRRSRPSRGRISFSVLRTTCCW